MNSSQTTDNLNFAIQQISESLLCESCLFEFDNKNRSPLNIPCGHTFCTECIENKNSDDCFTCGKLYESYSLSYQTLKQIKKLKNLRDTLKEQFLELTEQILELENGTYKGTTLCGVPHGRGTLKVKDNCIIKGEWKNGERHGRFKVMQPDGCLSEEEYNNGEKHGTWIYFWPDGTVWEQIYKDGKAIGGWTVKATV